MNIGIVTLNAKFIHTSLSLRYLRNAAREAGFGNVWIEEFVIDQPVWKVAAEILRRQPDVVGIGVYIWNRQQSFQLIELLKKQNPELTVAVGGPEVSFESAFSPEYTVISGEGESKWVEFLNYRKRGESPAADVLCRWRTYGTDLPPWRPPYLEEDLSNLENRIVYLETSRGCPYRCSFCLSALDETARYFDDDQVRGQIERLAKAGARTIKFIDRTFNLRPKRMQALMQWLAQFRGTSFHFEVVGDILTADILDFLKTVPEGMFQFEIGVQTVDGGVQSIIRRKQDNRRVFEAVENLVRENRVHVHCDLIFGLPDESFDGILQSFSTLVKLRPHELQLGFLKFLPGAPIRDLIETHEYRFQSFPPYEVVSHKGLSADQVIYLKKFAEVFDRFYNSKRFRFSIDRLLETWEPAKLFDRLLQYMETNDLFMRGLSLDRIYQVFFEVFDLGNDDLGADLLRLDYVYHQQVYRLPGFLQNRRPKGARFKSWSGDRKSPLFLFMHEIQFMGNGVSLNPASKPLYYAFVHPQKKPGYLVQPTVVREPDVIS
ncbi:MAG: DUF4080 domain-containing protein [Nitrospinales bacterium]